MIAKLIVRLGAMAATLAPALWAGMILGAGFIAVPAIFDVNLAWKPFAYGAAARVFERLGEAEWAFAAILIMALATQQFPKRRTIAALMLFLLTATQAIWLRPELAERAAILAAGGSVEPSPAHAIYAGLELLKLAWLAGLAYAGGPKGEALLYRRPRL